MIGKNSITELPAYKRLEEEFKQKGYTMGISDNMPIYTWDNINLIPKNVTPGHYVGAIEYCKIKFEDVPEEFRTRGFFLHTLSNAYKDVVEYVRTHPEKFDKQFFKDQIATDYYGLTFEETIFDWMLPEYIDEEMVMCAMLRAINMRYIDRRGECESWFYSVYRKKPELLTQDLYILGARCFAAKRSGQENQFLLITPEEYRTREYYLALCLGNSTRVMEDIPDEILTEDFFAELLSNSLDNIRCFSEAALEREVDIEEHGKLKIWQVAVMLNGYLISDIPLNEERIEFFLSRYDKDSAEYEYGFKSHYKEYLRENGKLSKPSNTSSEVGALITFVAAVSGDNMDQAIDAGTKAMKSSTNRQTRLPIKYDKWVPEKYCKKYDKEEYLLEIYQKIGIDVLEEADSYYYSVTIPDELTIVQENRGYSVKNEKGEILIHYIDVGPFYDRTVVVDIINVEL